MEQIIENILFLSGTEGIKLTKLAKIIEISDIKSLEKKLEQLKINFLANDQKIYTIENDDNIYYLKIKENSELLKYYAKVNTNLQNKLSNANLEVLAIIYSKKDITLTEINIIRGINSKFSIDRLLYLNLIQKNENKQYNITDFCRKILK